jgi:hypothetical protein
MQTTRTLPQATLSPFPTRAPWVRRAAMVALVALTSTFAVGSGGTSVSAAPPIDSVPLGLVSTFGVLTGAAVGNADPPPATVVRGDLGLVGALTGFPTGIYTGTLYEGPAAAPALADLQIAFDNANDRSAGAVLPGVLDGTTAGPGVHTSAAASGMAANGVFTIDGEGDPDSVFIFQVNGALALGADITMNLIGNAKAENVFWAVTGAGSIGAGSRFVGTLMATAAISSGHESTINGRLTSLSGAITMSGNQIYSSPPIVTIDGGTSASSTTALPTITGTTSLRSPATVSVTLDGAPVVPNPTLSATGTWSFEPAELMNGNHTIVASVIDGADNVGSFTQILNIDTVPPAVTIDGGVEVYTNTLTPRVSGTTDVLAGAVVTVTFTRVAPATTLIRSTLVQADLTWNMSPNGLTAGSWTVVASVSDTAGNQNTTSQSLHLDTTAPGIGVTSNALTNDPTPTISGTVESDSTVDVSVDGLTVGDVVVTGSTWTAQTTAALGHGTHHVLAAATDIAGNTTSPPITQSLMVDLILPLIMINPGATDATNDRTPTIVGSTDVTPGSGVIVFVSIDGAAPLTALVQPDGWNVTPSVLLAVGDHTIVASVSDPAGNIGSYSQTVTIDIATPSVSIDGGPSRTTTDATPTITGSSPDVAVGSPVTVTINDQTLTTAIAADGTFSVTAGPIPNDTHFAFVTVTDIAGNIGNDNQALTVNAVPPTVTYTHGPAAATNDATPLISGGTNAAAGATVTVTADGQSLHATVQPGGSWNVTAAHIDDGDITIVTHITDASGNIGSATQILTIDASTPTRITIAGGATVATNDATPMISGTTDAADGRILTVTIAGQTLTVSAAAGNWAVTAPHVADGAYDVMVSVTAVGGNAGSATQSLTIDTIVPVVVIVGGGDGTVETTDPTPPIAGSGATPGSTVTVTVAGETLTTTVAPDGTWAVTPTTPLPVGDNTVTVTITDPAGNTGTGTHTITVQVTHTTITIDGGTSAATNDDMPTISGSTNAANGRLLTVTLAAQTLTTFVAGGLWAVDAAHVDDGVYNVTASVGTADGTPAASSQALTIDAVVDNPPPVAEYTSVGPKRVFDTRLGAGASTLRAVPAEQVGGAHQLQVQMTDLAGYVPASGVGAVSLNVTSTGSTADGFITVYACGSLEEVSSVNFRAGQTVANAVIAPVSPGGAVCFYALNPTDVVVDINGWFAAGAAFHNVGPKRVFDTRAGTSPDALRSVGKSKLEAKTTMEVRVTDLAGYVPTDGVGSVSLNVVVTNPEAPGFITVFACGTMKEVSSVNFNGAGETVANAVIAPVSANGTICFYTLATTDLVVDINGWIESDSDFHGVDPTRVLDTRAGSSPDALRDVAKTKLGGGNVLEVQVTGLPGLVPLSGVTAVSLNVTATNTEAPGFITVFACGTMEEVSSVNFNGAGQTVANAVIAPVSASGTICFYALNNTDLVVDINGWIGIGPTG